MNRFLWIPGEGYDEAALKRLDKYFSMPSEPMGEAWFMREERYMYDYLCKGVDQIDSDELMKPLEEIASGTSSFGYLEEWYTWYNYLLPQLIPRSHEYFLEYMLEYLITGFATQYPEGLGNKYYSQFEEDILNTLGKCIMDKYCWCSVQLKSKTKI